jgi:hypothetical protein
MSVLAHVAVEMLITQYVLANDAIRKKEVPIGGSS